MRRTARPLREPVRVRPSTAGECERVHLAANPIRVMRYRGRGLGKRLRVWVHRTGQLGHAKVLQPRLVQHPLLFQICV